MTDAEEQEQLIVGLHSSKSWARRLAGRRAKSGGVGQFGLFGGRIARIARTLRGVYGVR
jgi:hypothetical protein